MNELVAARLTTGQQETVDFFRALAVPATWFVGEETDDGVEVIAIGDGFVWSFDIEPNGEYTSRECALHADGWSTGISV